MDLSIRTLDDWFELLPLTPLKYSWYSDLNWVLSDVSAAQLGTNYGLSFFLLSLSLSRMEDSSVENKKLAKPVSCRL